MSTRTSEDVDFGTSTSVSGDWQGPDYEALHVDVESASALLVVIVGDEVRLHENEKIGGDEARRFLGRCVKRVVHAAESFNGRPVEDAGGEIFAEFERVDDALKAALEMLRRVADLPPVSGLKLGLRIGFSYGLIAGNGALSSCEVAKTARSLAALARLGQIAACIRAQSALSPQVLARYDAHCQEPPLFERGPASAQPFVPAELAVCDEPLRHKGFLLKYGGSVYVLDDINEEIRIGRDDENHVVLRGRHASRFHATIKRRGNDIILVDTSTNGTFVSLKGEAPHLLLIQRECVLQGGGVLSFSTADPSSGTGTASARFEVL